jgi:hypothetical protein
MNGVFIIYTYTETTKLVLPCCVAKIKWIVYDLDRLHLERISAHLARNIFTNNIKFRMDFTGMVALSRP